MGFAGCFLFRLEVWVSFGIWRGLASGCRVGVELYMFYLVFRLRFDFGLGGLADDL